MNNTVTVTINDEEVKGIAQGMPIIDCLDETLDSSTLLIAPSTRKERFPIFGKVVITINRHVKYYYISEDDVDIICKSPLLYSHTVSLIEPTKILERIPCDNLTFTQPASQNSYPNIILSGSACIYDVIMRIRECCQLRRMDDPRPYPFEITNAALIAYLESIKAPQFFLNMGNVKDALNQVFKYLNAISRLENFTELTADFFNKYNELLSEEGILDEGQSQNIEDYATSLLSNISNAIADYDDPASVIVYPSKTDWASVRSESGGQLTDENMAAIVESPIYKINKFWIYVPIIRTRDIVSPIYEKYLKFDASLFLVEKSVYETLPVHSEWESEGIKVEDNSDQKGMHCFWTLKNLGKDAALYYEYRTNSINGLGSESKFTAFYSQPVITTLCNYGYAVTHNGVIYRDGDYVPSYPIGFKVDGEPHQKVLWRCEYISTTDTRIEVQKIDLSDHITPSVQQINQASNLVNIKAYGDNMSGLLQRMGNAEKIRTKLFKHYEDCPKVGDYTEDGYVVTTTQKAIYNDFVSCSIALTKNFNRKSQFVDVASEVRQFVIPAAGQSLERHSNYGEYIYIDTGSEYQDDKTSLLTDFGLQSFLKVFSGEATEVSPKLAELTGYPNRTDYQIYPIFSSRYIQVDTKGIANTVAFTFGFKDNRVVGDSTAERYQEVKDKVIQQPIGYTDEVGAFALLGVALFNNFSKSDGGDMTYSDYVGNARALPESSLNATNNAQNIVLNNYPINVSGTWKQRVFRYFKDGAEVTKITLQYHILPTPENAKKMIIGRGLALENPLIRDSNTAKNLQIFQIDDRFSLSENLKVRGTLVSNATITISESNYTVRFTNIPQGKSWCIGDKNSGLMYLAYNPDEGETPIQTLRLLRRVSRI